MNKVKLLSIIAVGLLAVNIFLLLHKPPHRKQEEPREIIIKKLHLDAQQIQEYEKLIDVHKVKIQHAEQEMMLLKNQLYKSLAETKENTSKDSLMLEIGKVQAEIEQINYSHFQDIKQLCKSEQLKYFDDFCLDITKLFGQKQIPPNEKK